MIQKTIPTCLVVLFLVINGFSQITSQQYVAPDGEFSYSIPNGWVLRDVTWSPKFKSAYGQSIDGFAPSINVSDESFSGTLDDYVASSLRILPTQYEKMGIKNFQVLDRSNFVTDAKQRGIKVITKSDKDGREARLTFYFFDGKNGKKFVVTCIASAQEGEVYDKIYDKSMKTFKTPASKD